MSWTTPCENCGGVSNFFKDPAGFFICLECGKQQEAYREEYRDEFDVLFEVTGQHAAEMGNVRYFPRAQMSSHTTATQQTTEAPPTTCIEDEDYDPQVENNDMDPDWSKKPPSEADFFRAVQSILMYCVEHFVDCLGFPLSLNHECRKIWFLILKLFVETDYPAHTFFCDLKSRRHKIGFRRTYSPKVVPLDPITLLEDDTIPLSVRLTAQHLGLNRLDYIKRVAPFYNCSGTRRRGPHPELVKIQSNTLPNLSPPPLCLTEKKDSLKRDAVEKPCLSVKHPQKKRKTLTLSTLTSPTSSSSWVNPCSALRPKRTVRERQREACVLLGIVPPKSDQALPPTRTSIPRYRIPHYMRATSSSKFSKYPSDEQEPTPLGFPEETLHLMIRERRLSLGGRYNPHVHSHVRSRHSVNSQKVSIWPNTRWQLDVIYEHDFFVALLTHLHEHYPTDAVKHLFVLENKDAGPLSTLGREKKQPVQETSDTQDKESNSSSPPPRQPTQQSKTDQLREWIDSRLNDPLSSDALHEWILTHPEIQEALEEWKKRGVMVSRLVQGVSVPSTKSPPSPPWTTTTTTAAHEKFFRHKTMRHELSVTAMIERILRSWMNQTYPSSSPLQDHQLAHQLRELSQLVPDVTDPEELIPSKAASQDNSQASTSHPHKDLKTMTRILLCSYAKTLETSQQNTTSEPTHHHASASARAEAEAEPQTEVQTDPQGALPPCLIQKQVTHQPEASAPEDTSALLPLKRLDPFYHQDDWSFSTVKTPIQRLLEWRRVLTRCYNTFKQQRDPSKSFSIFDTLAHLPPVSMNHKRVLENHELLELLKEAYLASEKTSQLSFLPVLQFLFNTSCPWYTDFLRSLAIRELYTLIAPPPLLKSRLYNETTPSPDPPKVDHILIVTLIWMSLLNLRYAVTAHDMCRWVETGIVPLNVALARIPCWLMEASGVCDKYSKFSSFPSVLRQDMLLRDRSILHLSEWIRPSDLERTLLNLKAHGLPLAPFSPIAFLPRLLHHCGLPPYLQPLVTSLLQLIQNPLTEYQDGYNWIYPQKNVLADALYGYLGPFPSLNTMAAAVIMVCRLVWSIFVYQPIGRPGLIQSIQQHAPLHYVPSSLRFSKATPLSQLPPLYFELAQGVWIATVPNLHQQMLQKTFSIANTGFLSSGLQALQWIKQTSLNTYHTLATQFSQTSSPCIATYQETRTSSKPTPLSDVHFLFAELLRQNNFPSTHPPHPTTLITPHEKKHDLFQSLPTNQQMFHRLVTQSNTPGWLASSCSWIFLNDSWHNSNKTQQHIMMSQLGHWIYRPTLAQGKYKDVVLSLTSEYSDKKHLWSCPQSLQSDYVDFLNEDFSSSSFTPPQDSPRHSKQHNDNTQLDIHSLDHLIHILYRIYFLEMLNTFQEPPMPTRCIHPVDTMFKSPVNDSPLDEIRFPVPYALLLRRIASFIGVHHLLIHSTATKLEYWLFVSEVPERFKRISESQEFHKVTLLLSSKKKLNRYSLNENYTHTFHVPSFTKLNDLVKESHPSNFSLQLSSPSRDTFRLCKKNQLCEALNASTLQNDRDAGSPWPHKDFKQSSLCHERSCLTLLQRWKEECGPPHHHASNDVHPHQGSCLHQGYPSQSWSHVDSPSSSSITCNGEPTPPPHSQPSPMFYDFHLWQHWIRSSSCRSSPNLLLYGFGSKQEILDTFVQTSLRPSFPTVAVFYGRHPQVNFLRFLCHLWRKLSATYQATDTNVNFKNAQSLQQAITKILNIHPRKHKKQRQQRFAALLASVAFGATSPTRQQSHNPTHQPTSCFGLHSFLLCLVIHHLDSPHLRPYQSTIAHLAMHPKILLISSVEHLRFPLLWDFSLLSKFQFLYLHVPTGKDYSSLLESHWKDQTPCWLSLSVEKHTLSIESICNALAVMPQKHQQLYQSIARLVYRESLKKTLQDQDSLLSLHISRHRLFKRSQLNMIYTDMTRFNAALQEFLDHRLLVETAYQERRGTSQGLYNKEMDYDHRTTFSLPFTRESLMTLFPQLLPDQQETDQDTDQDSDEENKPTPQQDSGSS